MKKYICLLLIAISLITTNSISAENNITKGYRGFVYANWLYGNDGVYHAVNDNGFGAYTTHGYQFNKHIFVGGGIGYQYHNMKNFDSSSSIPVYADFRADVGNSNITPFFEIKVGYSTGNFSGDFISPTIGVRIPTKGSIAFNIGVGYAAQQYKYENSTSKYKTTKTAWDHNVNVLVGVDF